MAAKESDTPLVSVIVPCYNSGKYLPETLDSVLLQTYANWECLIIDDGSTDNTKQICESYVKKDKRFKYNYQENKGVSNARNNGIRNCSGKYILPLDGDDKISSGYISDGIQLLESDNKIKLVYSKAKTFGMRSGVWEIPPYSFRGLLIENLIFCSAIIRKEDFLSTTGYDEKMSEGFEDWEFWITFLNEHDEVVQLPKVCFYYRLREISRNPKSSDDEKQKRIRNYIYKKHEAIYQKYFSLSDVLFDYYKAAAALESISNSTSYSIGKAILKPLWFFKKIFK